MQPHLVRAPNLSSRSAQFATRTGTTPYKETVVNKERRGQVKERPMLQNQLYR